jgi:hypothetical protein
MIPFGIRGGTWFFKFCNFENFRKTKNSESGNEMSGIRRNIFRGHTVNETALAAHLRYLSDPPWRLMAGGETVVVRNLDRIPDAVAFAAQAAGRALTAWVEVPRRRYVGGVFPASVRSYQVKPFPTHRIVAGYVYLLWRIDGDFTEVDRDAVIAGIVSQHRGARTLNGYVPIPGTIAFLPKGGGFFGLGRSRHVVVGMPPFPDAYKIAGGKLTGGAGKIVAPPSGPLTTSASEMAAERIEWLVPGVVPLGEMTLLGGAPGMGKSLAAVDFSATLSTGGVWPNGRVAERGGALIFETEDDGPTVVKPRLLAAGADLRRVRIGSDAIDLSSDDGLKSLEREVSSLRDCRLVVISPARSFFGDAEARGTVVLRGVLQRLIDLAKRKRFSVLCIWHPPGDKLYKPDAFAGAQEFLRAARAAWSMIPDPEDRAKNPRHRRRVMQAGKTNIAADGVVMRYRVESATVDGGIETSRIVWLTGGVGAEGEGEGEDGTGAGAGAVVVPLRKKRTKA